MSDATYKVIELVGSSKDSVEDAISGAVAKANESIQNLDWFVVKEIRGNIENGAVGWYQVSMSVGFKVLSRDDLHRGS